MRSESTPSRNRNFRRISQGILIAFSLGAAPPNSAFAQGAQASADTAKISAAPPPSAPAKPAQPNTSEYVLVEAGRPAWAVWGIVAGTCVFATALGAAFIFHDQANSNSDNTRKEHGWFESLYAPQYTDLERICAQPGAAHDCARQDKRRELWEKNRAWAGISYGVASAGIISAVVFLALSGPQKPEAESGQLKIAPAIGLQYQGMALQGSF